MTDRPILRLFDPTATVRLKGKQDKRRRPKGIGRQGQGARMGDKFRRLDEAFRGENAEIFLRQDPGGIAPERALVFETILPIHNFQKAATKIGFELLIEDRLDDGYDIPEALIDDNIGNATPTLYATMPTTEDLQRLLQLWKAYQKGENAPYGLAPWWNLFGMLLNLRLWGPQDRLTPEAKAEFLQRLSYDEGETIRLELEIWPTANAATRVRWHDDTRARVEALNGRLVSRSSIDQDGFIYEAILVEMSCESVRTMLANPFAPNGLATIEGLQFILPHTIGQSFPDLTDDDPAAENAEQFEPFDTMAPIRVVLLDGTPIAAHPALNGGVVIEDVHDLVRLSQVQHRRHATSMASLILRGDLGADRAPIRNARLLSIPVLVDSEHGATSPDDRLFVDLVHVALVRAFLGENPLAPDAFVVNFSIGVKGGHFAGRISSLARLLDWWADQQGILFMVSAGNVPDDLIIPSVTSTAFEDGSEVERQAHVSEAVRNARHLRTLMAPAEAMNALTVGAMSRDLVEPAGPQQAGFVSLGDDETLPALSSAVGLGAFKSIKPDFINTAGEHEIRIYPSGSDLRLRVVDRTQRTGLVTATVQRGVPSTYRTRGTSCANALSTRAQLSAAAALTEEGGPYHDQELSTRDLALLTKALSVNASRWPESAHRLYESEKARLNGNFSQAKEEVCRYYGHGALNERLMSEAPELGATMIGAATIRKDKAAIFNIPLPLSLSGERVGRSMRVSIAWFSPVLATRARYRLALLEAVPHGMDLTGELIVDDGWCLDMTAHQLDSNIIKRGTVWSRRLINGGAVVPQYGDGKVLPVRVQCRDGSGGGLSPDEDIRFAIAISLELEAETLFNIHQEIQNRLSLRVLAGQ
ncbi:MULTISPECIES: S8 family serine peptidase [Pacificibacter]|uniref:S8 family serine peptidase n=1 Tax=Pacificibacter TaxID=1042323 RepID=UPI001C099254|nr:MULTISPECIES: S8 family serine peptidase [Pacificibacter]MBU2937007.1 S8 family serine peptidase [Pacificibacter marinus]MDO6617183.1 S8 family serine peptidase [Pacificibacter sp. 1_MG-2023]